jgi:hypothetical protein
MKRKPPISKTSAEALIRAVATRFQIHGDFISAAPYGTGHINDTYLVTFNQAGCPVRYIFQRLNQRVFKAPLELMENVQRVTQHLQAKLAGRPDAARRSLTLVPSLDHPCCHRDHDGDYWRVYLYIAGARTFDAIESPRQAFEAARLFGEFQGLLCDLPAPRLHDTIPDFHHTPKRFAALESAIASDPANRAAAAKNEIAFALSRKHITAALLDANLPERVTHNDTKLNNVMLDDRTGDGVCVIDLDTVMPGLALYDFGDMVRTATSPALEDERDLAKVRMQFPMFEALARGYLQSTRPFITRAEKRRLPLAGKLITFEIGIRFLADFLCGDVYFKVHRPNHNLDRCRTQFRLVESIERQEEKMTHLVETFA